MAYQKLILSKERMPRQHVCLNKEAIKWLDCVLERLPVGSSRSELIRIIVNDYMDLFGGKMKFEVE